MEEKCVKVTQDWDKVKMANNLEIDNNGQQSGPKWDLLMNGSRYIVGSVGFMIKNGFLSTVYLSIKAFCE